MSSEAGMATTLDEGIHVKRRSLGKPVKDFVKRFEVCGLLSTVPSIVHGFVQARRWREECEKNSAKPVGGISGRAPNPLRTHFESVNQGRGIWKWSHYFDIYDRHFREFVGKEVHVAEVGIYSGGSLDMWKNYFGPRCTVHGIDVEEACKSYEGDRTKIYIGDQADRNFWKRFKEQVPVVDILIDDGGHEPEQQIVTLEEMLPHLSGRGVYLCEDIHGTHNRFAGYLHGLIASLNSFAAIEGPEAVVVPCSFQRFVYSIHSYPFVTVIEKTAMPVERFVAERRGTEWQPFFDGRRSAT